MTVNQSQSASEGTERTTVAAIFSDRAAAEHAINDLKAFGLRDDQIGVAMRERSAQGELIEEPGTKAVEGAVGGAVGGGLLGGVAGFLVGAGALVIPGIGPQRRGWSTGVRVWISRWHRDRRCGPWRGSGWPGRCVSGHGHP